MGSTTFTRLVVEGVFLSEGDVLSALLFSSAFEMIAMESLVELLLFFFG